MAPAGIPPGDLNSLGATSLRSLSSFISRSSSAATSSSFLHTVKRFASVVRRQQQQGTIVISQLYQGINAGPPPGNVAGIVLGSVAGALLVLWLLYMCFNIRKAPARSSVEDVGVEVLQNHGSSRRSHRRTHSTPSNRRSVSREVVEVRSPPRRHRERERVRETVVMEERRSPRREEEDIVEVIEEHSPPPRRHSSRRR